MIVKHFGGEDFHLCHGPKALPTSWKKFKCKYLANAPPRRGVFYHWLLHQGAMGISWKEKVPKVFHPVCRGQPNGVHVGHWARPGRGRRGAAPAAVLPGAGAPAPRPPPAQSGGPCRPAAPRPGAQPSPADRGGRLNVKPGKWLPGGGGVLPSNALLAVVCGAIVWGSIPKACMQLWGGGPYAARCLEEENGCFIWTPLNAKPK